VPHPALEKRVANLEGRVSGFEGHFETIYRRFDDMDRRFVWTVGIQVSVLIAVAAALVGR